ncbi:hypothetical protein E2562_001874 [Oryza meyeriana var. granulata]|uniref:Retroviral polymerase SH3-like domain-containing protein n=1 Tax=Oryza meyeriana var. granulata TaxID=110450 RepID=A0A6G1C423_9ORYZ|nr:hypothetical protein E2562_001874 [Oryza meyeriana var. granulata]
MASIYVLAADAEQNADSIELDELQAQAYLGHDGDTGAKAYRLFDPVAQKVIVSRDMVLDKAVSWD